MSKESLNNNVETTTIIDLWLLIQNKNNYTGEKYKQEFYQQFSNFVINSPEVYKKRLEKSFVKS